MSRYLPDALEYRDRDWSIIPIGLDKLPRCRWRPFQHRRPEAGKLRQWFQRDDVRGLAVIFGAVSGGLACRDFDRLDGYERWAAERPDLARTLPTVATARGRHVYLRAPVEQYRELEDGEYRGNCKHYCILPPSVHPSGAVYRWEIPLPDGPLPLIVPESAGLLTPASPGADRRDATEQTEQAEQSQAIEGGGGPDCGVQTESPKAPAPANVVLLTPELSALLDSTLPQSAGVRNRRVFDLCRVLKAQPALADLPPKALRNIVREWHRRALPTIGTKAFDDSWADFVVGWGRVRFPAGEGIMDLAFQRAVKAEPPALALELYESAECRLLVSLCRELQREWGTRPFYLGCRTVAGRFGVDPATASRWLRTLVADGVLEVVDKGGQAHNPRKASRFRYRADDSCVGTSSAV